MYEVYLHFLEVGWKLSDIDDLDYPFWADLTDYKEKKREREARQAYLRSKLGG